MNNTRLLIAVVDGEEPVRAALRRLLCSASLRVETFSSGPEFFEFLGEHQPDCLVLDLYPPHINGFAVQARLAETGTRLPTVVTSGHDSDEDRERALSGGAAAYLTKPLDDQALLDAITRAVEPNKHDKVTIDVQKRRQPRTQGRLTSAPKPPATKLDYANCDRTVE